MCSSDHDPGVECVGLSGWADVCSAICRVVVEPTICAKASQSPEELRSKAPTSRTSTYEVMFGGRPRMQIEADVAKFWIQEGLEVRRPTAPRQGPRSVPIM